MQVYFIIRHPKAGQNLNADCQKCDSAIWEFQLETFLNFYNEIQMAKQDFALKIFFQF